MPKKIDLTDQTFGERIVLGPAPSRGKKSVLEGAVFLWKNTGIERRYAEKNQFLYCL